MKPSAVINNYRERLIKLNHHCIKIGMDVLNDALMKRVLETKEFEIAFVGEFSAGKSTLINALLGVDLLPTLLEPTTARVTKIRYSETPKILLIQKGNKIKDLQYDDKVLHNFIASNPKEVENIGTIEVGYPSPMLKDGFIFIDTPGTNDTSEERMKITYEILPEVDAVVYVTVNPVTESNLQSFKNHVLGNNIQQVFIVLNKRDLCNTISEDKRKSIQIATKKEFEEQYNNNGFRIKNDLEIPFISAADYIDGIEEKDESMLESSNMKEFLELLNNYVQGSSKYELLNRQYESHFNSLKEQALSSIKIRITSLSLPEGEFNLKKNKLTSQIEFCEKQVRDIKSDSSAQFNQLINQLESSFDKLNANLMDQILLTIDQYQGNVQELVRSIELTTRQRYEDWMIRNEVMINQLVQGIQNQISLKFGKVIEKLETSLQDFHSAELQKYSHEIQMNKRIRDITDSTRTRTYMQLTSGIMTILLYGTIGPLSVIILPLGFIFADWRRKDQIKKVKAEVTTKITNDYKEMKASIRKKIETLEEEIISELSKVFDQVKRNIENQLSDVEIQRKSLKVNYEKQTADLTNVMKQIEAI